MSILTWVFLVWAVVASAAFVWNLFEYAKAVDKIDEVRTKLCKACALIMSLDIRLMDEPDEPYSGRVTHAILKHLMDEDVEMEIRPVGGRVLKVTPAPTFADDDDEGEVIT